MPDHDLRKGKQLSTETLGARASFHRGEVASGTSPESGLSVISSVVSPADVGQGHATIETLFFDATAGEAWPPLTTKFINDRGDQVTRTTTRVAPATALPSDSLTTLKIDQQAETVDRAVLVVDTVSAHSPLNDFGYELELGQGARTYTQETIISPPALAAASLPALDAETILNATIEKLSATKSIKKIQTLLESQPTVPQWEHDERTGLPLLTLRKIINTSAVPLTYANFNSARSALSLTAQDVLEYNPISKWFSIQIVRKVPNTIDDTVIFNQYPATTGVSFPNVLISASFIDVWAAVLDGSSVVSFDMDVGMRLDIVEGYSGDCEAVVYEYLTTNPKTFFTHNPTLIPTKINPQAHRVEAGVWFGGGSTASAQIKTWEIPSALHPEMTIGYSTEEGLSGGNYLSEVVLPATSPEETPTDFIKDVTPEKWRFGVYIMRVMRVFHPGTTTPEGTSIAVIRPTS